MKMVWSDKPADEAHAGPEAYRNERIAELGYSNDHLSYDYDSKQRHNGPTSRALRPKSQTSSHLP